MKGFVEYLYLYTQLLEDKNKMSEFVLSDFAKF